ncbi:MAG: hypothetical protein IKD36_02685 [Clostridia bacterium]|nr:hypothetical protein [Clostridia bacterium]
MGFAEKFWRGFAHLICMKVGFTSGSDFPDGNVTPGTIDGKKDGKKCLTIFGSRYSDFSFTKDDIKKLEVIQAGLPLTIGSTRYIVTKFRIEFKNGKVAVMCVPEGNALKRVEEIIY